MWRIKNNNSLGEISPYLRARSELDLHDKGLAYLKNATGTIEGGLKSLPELAALDQLTLVAGKFKVFKYRNTEYRTLKYYLIVFKAAKMYIVSNTGGVLAVEKELDTSYTESDLDNISFSQINDNHFLVCCRGYKPSMIRVIEDTPGFSKEVAFWDNILFPPSKEESPVWGAQGTTEIGNGNHTLFQWYKSGTQYEFKAKVAGDILDTAYFDSLDKGQIYLYGGKFYVTETKLTSGYQHIICNQIDSPEVLPTEEKDVDGLWTGNYLWTDTDIRDYSFLFDMFRDNRYPAIGTFYQGRIIFAGLEGNPSCIAASKVNELTNFRAGSEDSDGFVTFLPSGELEEIQDLIGYNSLIATTDRGVWATLIGQPLTPSLSNMYLQKMPIPANGIGKYQVVDGILFYITENLGKIHTMEYNGDEVFYQSNEMTTYTRHMFNSIKGLSEFKIDGENYLAAIMAGEVALCKIDAKQNIISWTRGGYDNSNIQVFQDGSKTYVLDDWGGDIRLNEFSTTVFKKMEFELMAPRGDERTVYDLPFVAKDQFEIGRVKVMVQGDFDLEVNAEQKRVNFGADNTAIKTITFHNVRGSQDEPLRFKQLNTKPVVILAVYFEVEYEKE